MDNDQKATPQVAPQGAAQDNSDPTGKIAKQRELDRLLKLSPSETFKMYGVKEEETVLDAFGEVGGGPDRDDPESRAAFQQLQTDFGGPAGLAAAQRDLAEAASVFDVDGDWTAEFTTRTAAGEAQGVKEIVAEYREALANREKAAALLELIYASPDHPYFKNATPEMIRAMNRLWRASYGEPTD